MLSRSGQFILVFVSLLTFPIAAKADSTNKIEGVVLDKNDNPVYSVLIRAYRNNKKISKDKRTEKDGSYLLSFKTGTPIKIQYNHNDYHVGRVDNICGSRNHDIGKTLYCIDEELSSDQKQNLIATYTQVYLTDKAMGVSDKQFFSQYEKSLSSAKFSIDMLVSVHPEMGNFQALEKSEPQ